MIVEELKNKAREIRQDLIRMLVEAKSGHTAGPLDLADIFTCLYFGDILKFDPQNPEWEDRDRLVISCGHTVPILYTTLIHAGILPKVELLNLRKLGTLLQGHPHHEQEYPDKTLKHPNTPGIENSAGPLGQGISVAVGMALAGKMDDKKWRVYVVGSDGEMQEGQVWESLMFAGNNKLDNLTYIIDRNNIQIDGYTEKVQPLEPLADKLKAFNFHVLQMDGNLIEDIVATIKESWKITDKPVAIIANTIPGYGVQEITGDFEWHGKTPSREEGQEFIAELRSLQGRIISEG